MGATGALAPVLLQHGRSSTATGALPPFKTDVIILCTEFYHLGEGAHFASCYIMGQLWVGPDGGVYNHWTGLLDWTTGLTKISSSTLTAQNNV